MNSTPLRLFIWFSATFLVVSIVFLVTISVFHGVSFGARTESIFAIGMLAAFLVVSLILARSINHPIDSINRQLTNVHPQNVNKKIWLEKTSPPITQLVESINELSSRVHIEMMHANEFSRQVAHELRTPLSILRLKIEQAAERIDAELADELQSELSRLTQDVEQMLLIARSERGQLVLHKSNCSLDVLMADVVSDFRLIAQEDGRDIQVISTSCKANVDGTYLRLILQNLLTNAVRHGRGNVRVRIRCAANEVNLLIYNERKGFSRDDHHLGLGNRVVNALVNAHKNMEIWYHDGTIWYAALITIGQAS